MKRFRRIMMLLIIIIGLTGGGAIVANATPAGDTPQPAPLTGSSTSHARVQQSNEAIPSSITSLDFYKAMGWQEAVDILTDPKISGQSWLKLGDPDSATSLNHLQASIKFMRETNTIRKGRGLSELQYNARLDALAQVAADYNVWGAGGHNYYDGSQNLAFGFDDPLDGWYTSEKQTWDQLVADDPSLAKYEQDAIGLNRDHPDIYQQVGHYLNIVEDDQKYIGEAVAGENYSTHAQNFNNTDRFIPIGGSLVTYQNSMSVDAYETALNKFIESIQIPSDSKPTVSMTANTTIKDIYGNPRSGDSLPSDQVTWTVKPAVGNITTTERITITPVMCVSRPKYSVHTPKITGSDWVIATSKTVCATDQIEFTLANTTFTGTPDAQGIITLPDLVWTDQVGNKATGTQTGSMMIHVNTDTQWNLTGSTSTSFQVKDGDYSQTIITPESSIVVAGQPLTFSYTMFAHGTMPDSMMATVIRLPDNTDSDMVSDGQQASHYTGGYELTEDLNNLIDESNSGQTIISYSGDWFGDDPTAYSWYDWDTVVASNAQSQVKTILISSLPDDTADQPVVAAAGTITLTPTGNANGDIYSMWPCAPYSLDGKKLGERSQPATITIGEKPSTGSGEIHGTLWWDTNNSGEYDTDDQPVSNDNQQGITVNLYRSDDLTTPVATTLTVDGAYSFTKLLAGSYRVQVARNDTDDTSGNTLPTVTKPEDDYYHQSRPIVNMFTYETDTPSDMSGDITVTDQPVNQVDFGYQQPVVQLAVDQTVESPDCTDDDCTLTWTTTFTNKGNTPIEHTDLTVTSLLETTVTNLSTLLNTDDTGYTATNLLKTIGTPVGKQEDNGFTRRIYTLPYDLPAGKTVVLRFTGHVTRNTGTPKYGRIMIKPDGSKTFINSQGEETNQTDQVAPCPVGSETDDTQCLPYEYETGSNRYASLQVWVSSPQIPYEHTPSQQNTTHATTPDTPMTGEQLADHEQDGTLSTVWDETTGSILNNQTCQPTTNDNRFNPTTGSEDSCEQTAIRITGSNQTAYLENNLFGSISGLAWVDSNQNGLQDDNQTNIDLSGLTISLYQTELTTPRLIATTTTNRNGVYTFNNLPINVNCVRSKGENHTIPGMIISCDSITYQIVFPNNNTHHMPIRYTQLDATGGNNLTYLNANNTSISYHDTDNDSDAELDPFMLVNGHPATHNITWTQVNTDQTKPHTDMGITPPTPLNQLPATGGIKLFMIGILTTLLLVFGGLRIRRFLKVEEKSFSPRHRRTEKVA